MTDLFWFGPVAGGVVGMIAGVIGGAIAERRAAARREVFATEASRLGAQSSAADDAELQENLSRDFPGDWRGMSDVVHKDFGGLPVSIGQLTIRSVGAGSEAQDRTSTQTAAYSHVANFPQFGLKPSQALLKTALRLAGSLAISVPDDPEFTNRFMLIGMDIARTRALFNAPVRAWLKAHPDLTVEAAGTSVLLYRDKRKIEPTELAAFLREAGELFRLLEQAQRALPAQPSVSSKQDAEAFLANMPAAVAAKVRGRIVTQEHLREFLRQDPPRKVPANIAHHCDHFAPLIGIAFGAAFAAAGLFFGAVSLLKGEWGGVAFAMVFLIIGSVPGFFFGRTRLRMMRLLRHGRLTTATVEKVESTGSTTDSGAIYNVVVRHVPGEASCKIVGSAAQRAQSMVGKPAEILHLPADPQRIILVDALVNV